MASRGQVPALQRLAHILELSSFEQDVILLALAPEIDARFAQVFTVLHDDARRDVATLHLALELFVDATAQRLLVRDVLMPSRPLRRLRIVRCDEPAAEPLLTRPLRLDERVVDYLRGVDRLDARLDGVLRPVTAGLLTPAHSAIAEKLASTLRRADEGWPVVNLVGAYALGARDVAADACARAETYAMTIDVKRLAAESAPDRRELLALLSREALLSPVAYLIDGDAADAVDPTLRAVVTALIEEVTAPFFLTSRERWSSDAVTRLVRVTRPDRAEQRQLWHATLAIDTPAIREEVDRITQQFDFGPVAIAEAVRRARETAHARKTKKEDPLSVTPADLWNACRDQSGLELEGLAQRLVPSYGKDDIVLPAHVRAQLDDLAQQVEHRTQVYERWKFGEQLGRGRGITALFAGPSGTGKTMAAEILAGRVGLDLYRIDLAGVVSKYIGETEKNLRRVFDAAERTGAILFFDEADALFGTRTEVKDSHDRYANIEVNYLLQRMEGYTGLAILATNRKAALDAAFLRRLRFVVEFPFPSADDRRRIWQRVFPEEARPEPLDYGFLSRLELAGGNIRSVAVNAAFLAAAEGEGSVIGMRHVVRAAAREYGKIERPISIAEFGVFYPMVRPS
jgi:SpoVK/Ycf46/Vps4 family AAA+-type ATPase